MKSPRPDVLRRGCVLEIAGTQTSANVPVRVVSYGDLRFGDGHVERWYGTSTEDTFPGGSDGLQALYQRATDFIDLQGVDLVFDMGPRYEDVSAAWFDAAPVEHVVTWNADVDRGGPPLRTR